MDIFTILEQLAITAQHQFDINLILADQPRDIKEAFFSHDSILLKKNLGDISCLPDKCTVCNFS